MGNSKKDIGKSLLIGALLSALWIESYFQANYHGE